MALSASSVPASISEPVLEYLRQTPYALAVLVFSYFSGQLWTFLILGYLKKGTAGNRVLNSVAGKVSLGIAWFALVLVPIFYLSHESLRFTYDSILSVVIATLVAGLCAQVLTVAWFITWR
jgi:hypothetical protein